MAARRASDGGGSIGSGGQHAVLASKFRNYIVIISEPGHGKMQDYVKKDAARKTRPLCLEVEAKIRAAQELSENFDVIAHDSIRNRSLFPLQNIVTSPQHATFLEQAVPRFLAFLREGAPRPHPGA